MTQPIEQAAWDAFKRDDHPEVTAEDLEPRTAGTGPKPPVTDPEAPYGWMIDPKAPGGRRPKKRPGKQSTRAVAPPAKRPATEPRTRPASSAGAKPQDFTPALVDTAQGLWMLLAGIPTPDEPTKLLGVDLQGLSVRLKAQAAVLDDNTGQIVGSINLMAQHSKPVRNAVEKYTAESGPAWIIPAMMALLPFAVQSAALWRAPVVGDLTELAKKTDAKFDQVVKAMTLGPLAVMVPDEAESVNGDSPTPG